MLNGIWRVIIFVILLMGTINFLFDCVVDLHYHMPIAYGENIKYTLSTMFFGGLGSLTVICLMKLFSKRVDKSA